ncbi:puromycin-sensitive aminopeptidase-like protein, partial [Leptotrombidium deliense]
CFDEPAFKATFKITIIAPKDRTVLSNMRVTSVSTSETEKATVFALTPKMSTYLLCFVVGDYDYVESTSTDGRVKVRVYTPVGQKEEGNFALQVAVKSVDFLQNYLGVKYPLTKLDLIGIKDFGSGAMENWGLMTFQESILYINEKTSPVSQRQTCANVVAHEIAHQ